jgi:hypothetical protein
MPLSKVIKYHAHRKELYNFGGLNGKPQGSSIDP